MKKKIVSTLIFFLLGVHLLHAQYNEKLNQEIFKNHKGEILFSTHKIDLANFRNEDIKKSFDLLDEVYSQVILEKTLSQTYAENGYTYSFNSNNKYMYNYALRLSIDGEKKARWLFELPESYFKHTLTFDMILSSNNSVEKRRYSDFVNEWVM